MEEGLITISSVAAVAIGYIGVLVMVYGALRSTYLFTRGIIRREHNLPMVRVDLGKHLALGLEFLVGKDIIESIIHPTWDELGKLGAIIVLRTVLQIFLARELKELESELTQEKHLSQRGQPPK